MINQTDLYFKRELDKRKPSRVVEGWNILIEW